MKRFVISVSVLLFTFFGLMTIFAQVPVNPSRLMPEPNQPAVSADIEPNTTKTTTEEKSKTETDILADPNRIEAAIQAFDGLQKELDEINRKGGDETRQWLQQEPGNKLPLAKDVHERVMAELMFIRKLAVEESAKKTTAAVDGLLLKRQQQFDELNEKFKEERIRQLRQERGARSRRRSRQDMQQQGPDAHEQYQPKTRSRRR